MRPIDLQGIVTKTQDIERLHRVQQHHPVLSQEQFSERLRREAEANLRRVRFIEESPVAGIRERRDEGKQRQHASERERQDSRPDRGDEALGCQPGDQLKGRHIDVKA
ncbi:MAG: hypothetical protein WBH35_04520 [Bacillota bacterium]|nr:hypothetical protein [Bacillota bacterium]HOB92056.1 hypothetical protein [Bacillota bacterium]HPZ54379.1 hypothetical protein [Bacillota bacterium]HQD18562.1 hypothetical protein [Bacillota bacterium]